MISPTLNTSECCSWSLLQLQSRVVSSPVGCIPRRYYITYLARREIPNPRPQQVCLTKTTVTLVQRNETRFSTVRNATFDVCSFSTSRCAFQLETCCIFIYPLVLFIPQAIYPTLCALKLEEEPVTEFSVETRPTLRRQLQHHTIFPAPIRHHGPAICRGCCT